MKEWHHLPLDRFPERLAFTHAVTGLGFSGENDLGHVFTETDINVQTPDYLKKQINNLHNPV